MTQFDFLPSEPWAWDEFSISEDGPASIVKLTGWAFPDPMLGGSYEGHFLLNGKPFDDVLYPLLREDVAKVFWQRRNSVYSGFSCSATIPTADLYPNGSLEISFLNPGLPRLICAQQSWFKCDPLSEPPIPEEGRRFRVIGSYDQEHFLRGGFTDFKRLEAAVTHFTGSSFSSGQRVLDFGCGCGRVSRYFSHLSSRPLLTGLDIDADNVAWCSANLSGSFLVTSLNPPTSLPAKCFDLIYGISVFTHLRETVQDLWLAELDRLSAVDGFLFITIHSETALNYAWQGPDVYSRLKKQIYDDGLYVSDGNHQLDGHVEQPGEYVNVFHDVDYVRRHWGKYFEIVDILPGYIFTHDLIVMRKRRS